jgi:alpha-beta hydrolase superfamily lysophospholipase
LAYNEFSLKTFDGLTLFGRRWIPDSEPKAIVNLVHSLGEHSGRYYLVAKAFVQAGYMVTSIDLRGHGQSEGPRGHTPSFDALVTDVEFLVKMNRSENHGKREYIYGHGLGGSVGLYYNLTCDNYVDGIITTSPFIKIGSALQQSISGLGRTLADITPTLSGTFALLYSMLSRDSAIMKAYSTDPLIHNRITAKMESDMKKKGDWIFDHRNNLKGPILMVVGSGDRVIDTQRVMSLAAGLEDRVSLKVWEGLFHETHNEPEKVDVMRFNVDWLDHHLT